MSVPVTFCQTELPKNHAHCHGDVQGMFGAELGYLYRVVRIVHYGLLDPVHLVSEDEGVESPLLRSEILQLHGMFGLLYTYNSITLSAQQVHDLGSIVKIFPGHARFRPECGLVDFGRRGAGAYTAKENFVRLEGVGGTESTPHVVGTSDVVEYENET